MKKILICIVACLSCLSITVNAQTISVNDVYAVPGSTAYFTTNLTGGKVGVYESFGFNINYPEGFSSTGEYLTNWEKASVEFGPIRAGMINSNYLPTSDLDNILSVEFAVDKSVQPGTYEITLTDIELGYNKVYTDKPEAVTFNVIVSDILILDENAEVAPKATTSAQSVKVLRTIKANEWSTICLPFALNNADLKKTFGDDVEVALIDGYEVEEDGGNIIGLNVSFSKEGTMVIRANTPYIIKVGQDVSDFTVSKKVAPANVEKEVENDDLEIYITMKGTYSANTVVPANSLFLSEGKFWYSVGKTKMKAFRAYFTFMDVLSSLDSASSRVKFFVTDGDTATEIQIPELMPNDGEYYDLRGLRVETPAKGVYIKDGKKVVVK